MRRVQTALLAIATALLAAQLIVAVVPPPFEKCGPALPGEGSPNLLDYECVKRWWPL
jgi:hypothetical protein